MKKFKERMAERAGFTLVELIVVIAILGILAGIAVPAYTGYIKKANEASDYMRLDAIKTAVIFTATEDKLDETDVQKIEVTESGVTYYNGGVETANAIALTSDADFLRYAEMNGTYSFDFKSEAEKATWTASNETWKLDYPTNP